MFARNSRYLGFTLMEMMMVLAILAIVAAIAWPSYQNHVRQTRLNEAKSALLNNSQALERFYSQNHRFKINSTTWMPLPITETAHFCLRLQRKPRGTHSDNIYTLKAVAFQPEQEPRIIKISQDLTVMVCEESSSRCSESTPFFTGGSSVDKRCKIIGTA